MTTYLLRGNDKGEILDADGKVVGRVVPVEPVASLWLQHGEIVNAFPHPPSDPRQWDYDGHFRSKGYSKEPLYRAATLDLAGVAVKVPSTHGFNGIFAAGMKYVLDALEVKP